MPALKREVLTRAAIESARPKASAYRLWDARQPGLCLRVLPSGIKTFEVHFARGASERIGRFPTITLDAARTQAQMKLGEFAKTGERSNKRKAETFGTFIDDSYAPWMEAERKTGVRTIAVIRKEFADLLQKPIGEVTAFAIEKYKATRLKAGINPATVNRDVVRIKAAMAKAVEWKVIAENPLRSVKRTKGENQGRVRFLSEAEERALRGALERREEKYRRSRDSGNAWRAERGRDALPAIVGYCDHLTPMTLVALNTGLRRGELTSITWADVNLPGKLVTVQAAFSKSSKTRHVPLNSEAMDVLRNLRKQQKGEGRLFPIACPKKAWNALTAAAKIENFRFHDLRHTFASKLVMAGVDLNTVRELLGHGDIAMTMRYAHLAPEHKAAAVERLVSQPGRAKRP